MIRHDHLRRLPPAYYRGHAWVHWTMTMADRKTGWLDPLMHRMVRELLLHTLCRHHLHCAAYCLMPDHAHFRWLGLSAETCHLAAARFFRRHWNDALASHGCQLQTKAYDHVLEDDERHPDAFADTVLYVMNNPVRAGLVAQWADWPYLGCVLPGYPDLPVAPIAKFWPRFWQIHNGETTKRKPMGG